MSIKQFKRWFLLILVMAFASFFILVFKNSIFQDYYAIMGVRIKRALLDDWLNQVFLFSNLTGYITGVLCLVFWLVFAARYQATNSKSVIPKRIAWLSIFFGHIVFNLLLFFSLSFLYHSINYRGFLIYYPLSIVIDSLLLFWLPSAIATPGTMRNVPPLAMSLRKFYGG